MKKPSNPAASGRTADENHQYINSKECLVSYTSVHGASKTAKNPKSGLWLSLLDEFRAWKVRAAERREERAVVEYDWSEPESPKSLPPAPHAHPALGPSSLPNDPAGSGHTQRIAIPHQPKPQSRPLPVPAVPARHTLAWMMHRLADLLTDPNLTAEKAVAALQEPNHELSVMFEREKEIAEQARVTAETLARRTARNAEAAVAAARGLEVAHQTPGVSVETAATEDGEFVPALAERMVAGAVGASDTTVQTGMVQRITEDMPDPRTVAKPRDVNPGDVEPAVSPVHSETTGTLPAVPPSVPLVEPAEPWTADDDTHESAAVTEGLVESLAPLGGEDDDEMVGVAQ